jgi:hypothetical protein
MNGEGSGMSVSPLAEARTPTLGLSFCVVSAERRPPKPPRIGGFGGPTSATLAATAAHDSRRQCRECGAEFACVSPPNPPILGGFGGLTHLLSTTKATAPLLGCFGVSHRLDAHSQQRRQTRPTTSLLADTHPKRLGPSRSSRRATAPPDGSGCVVVDEQRSASRDGRSLEPARTRTAPRAPPTASCGRSCRR